MVQGGRAGEGDMMITSMNTMFEEDDDAGSKVLEAYGKMDLLNRTCREM